MHGVQQFIGKFAANNRADLDHLLGRSQPIEPRHQRIMQRRRNRATREPAVATFEHCPRQLLDEQRHPAGPLDHRRYGLIG